MLDLNSACHNSAGQQEDHGRLVICPTPIGNLRDITLRTLDALANCDYVCAEDTRVTAKLLNAYNISKPLIRMDENTIKRKASGVIADIQAGKQVCYCSDAGMPGVSDPGIALLALAYEQHVSVCVLPGASASITAFVASALSFSNFYFVGFPPRKKSAFRELLNALTNLPAAIIFYESPHRLIATLELLAEVFPQRKLCVLRELTKVHEEVYRDSTTSALEHFSARAQRGGIRGELVIVLDGARHEVSQEEAQRSREDVRTYLEQLAHEGMSMRDARKKAAESTDLPKNEIYNLALEVYGKKTRQTVKS